MCRPRVDSKPGVCWPADSYVVMGHHPYPKTALLSNPLAQHSQHVAGATQWPCRLSTGSTLPPSHPASWPRLSVPPPSRSDAAKTDRAGAEPLKTMAAAGVRSNPSAPASHVYMVAGHSVQFPHKAYGTQLSFMNQARLCSRVSDRRYESLPQGSPPAALLAAQACCHCIGTTSVHHLMLKPLAELACQRHIRSTSAHTGLLRL